MIAPSKPPALHVSRYVLGGTRWVRALLYVGPYTPFGVYNANYGEGRSHDNHFPCPLALQSRCAPSRCVQSLGGSRTQPTLTVKQLFVEVFGPVCRPRLRTPPIETHSPLKEGAGHSVGWICDVQFMLRVIGWTSAS